VFNVTLIDNFQHYNKVVDTDIKQYHSVRSKGKCVKSLINRFILFLYTYISLLRCPALQKVILWPLEFYDVTEADQNYDTS
jgi:hypothetical protein